MSRGIPRRIGPTYRIQLVEGHGFTGAAALVPYLARLGIQTVYLSPVAEAVPGSAHGYDGTDPTALRQSLGGIGGYVELYHACEAHGLGILVDWVPNHLSTWTGGPWLRRLLAEGRDAEIAQVFDIDWDAGGPADRGKVALPLLDRPVPDAVAAGAITLGTRHGVPVIEVAGTDLPVAGGAVRAGEDVTEVLSAQHYRLIDWHDASARNYRRFFDIDGLVGVRVQDLAVFERTHTLIGALAAANLISGVRVDHVDGLAEPAAYLRRLNELVGVPVVVEKILTADERLPHDWPVLGSTGYEVVDDIGGALVDPDGLHRLVDAGRADGDQPVHELTVATRELVAATSFPGDLARAAGHLDVPVDDLVDTVVRLSRYRTYLSGGTAGAGGTAGRARPVEADEADAAVWREAAAGDPRRSAVVDAVVDPGHRAGAVRLQQLTGAVMAKGIEDTAWYRLSGPLAFCEVGGDAAVSRRGGWERLVRRATDRVGAAHAGLIPGSTHDTKRSADVRCRLYALSERPASFEEGLARLRELLGLPGGGGDLATQTRVLGQLLLGVLPPLPPDDPAAPDAAGDAGWPEGDELADRLCGALKKGLREAKDRSSWQAPDTAYEGRLEDLARRAVGDGAALVHRAFGDLVTESARLGAVNAMSSVVLRHVLPGIPDCFEGDEAWHLALVDPDSRRPVDTGRMAVALASVAPALAGDLAALVALRRGWRDGRVKLALTAGCLATRSAWPEAFEPDAPVSSATITGAAARCAAGLARGGGDQLCIGVVTRRAGSLVTGADDLPHGPSYRGSELHLPDGAPSHWREALSGRPLAARAGVLPLDEVFAVLPVALLVPGSAAPPG